MIKIQKICRLGIVCFLLSLNIYAQTTLSAYGTPIIEDRTTYLNSVEACPDKQMIPLTKWIPGIQLDLRYASQNNFTGIRLYPTNTHETYLRKPAAIALARVAATLEKEGFQLLIFDAYRPYQVTVRFWKLIGDERYVAHPGKGSGHNRGLSVDLTIINKRNMQPIDMGTGFDHFSDTAHHSFKGLAPEILQNRLKLKQLMMQAGFQPLETEWWHYSWPNTFDAEVLNIPFKKF